MLCARVIRQQQQQTNPLLHNPYRDFRFVSYRASSNSSLSVTKIMSKMAIAEDGPEKKTPHKNCFICYYRPSLNFGCVTMTLVSFGCDHSQRPVRYFMKRSWVASTIALLIVASMVTVGFHHTYVLYESSVKTRESVLLLCYISIDFAGAVLLTWMITFKIETLINEFKGWMEIIKECEAMGIIILDNTFMMKAHIVLYVSIAVYVALEISTLVVYIFHEDYSLQTFEWLCTDAYIFMQDSVNTHYLMAHLLLRHSFRKVLFEMEETLRTRMECNVNDWLSVRYISQPFRMKMRRLLRTYESIYLNFLEMAKFMHPAFLIWWNMTLIVNITCAYVLINSIIIGQPLDLFDLIFVVNHYGCFLLAVGFLFAMEMIAKLVSNFEAKTCY